MQLGIDQARDFLEFLANTSDGVYAVDADHRIILWNRAAEEILGYAAAEVLGEPCYQILGSRDAAGNVVCHAACQDISLAKGRDLVPSRDMLTKAKDGRKIWVNVTNMPIPSKLNGLFALVHIFRDISTAKHLERFAEGLSSMVDEFMAYRTNKQRARRMSPAARNALTPREREVLGLLARGANTGDVAAALTISIATARKHTQNILTKLNVHSALEAVASAFLDDGP